MPRKHPDTERIDGPHTENRMHPENFAIASSGSRRAFQGSGGGGERGSHHAREPTLKGEKPCRVPSRLLRPPRRRQAGARAASRGPCQTVI
jgi:hypothetical protein